MVFVPNFLTFTNVSIQRFAKPQNVYWAASREEPLYGLLLKIMNCCQQFKILRHMPVCLNVIAYSLSRSTDTISRVATTLSSIQRICQAVHTTGRPYI